jgi:hypothetical protein
MAQTCVRRTTRASAQALERESRLVREAIALVAMGASTRVVVAGIRNGEALLDEARRDALAAGVRVNPLRREKAGLDLVVEPIYE